METGPKAAGTLQGHLPSCVAPSAFRTQDARMPGDSRAEHCTGSNEQAASKSQLGRGPEQPLCRQKASKPADCSLWREGRRPREPHFRLACMSSLGIANGSCSRRRGKSHASAGCTRGKQASPRAGSLERMDEHSRRCTPWLLLQSQQTLLINCDATSCRAQAVLPPPTPHSAQDPRQP